MKITNRLTLSVYCILFVFAGVIGAYGGLSELLLIAHAQSNDIVEQTETLIYDYPNLGFTLEYPSDWSKQESLFLYLLLLSPLLLLLLRTNLTIQYQQLI